MLYGILDKEFKRLNCPLKRVNVNVCMDRDIAFVNITQEYFHKGNSNIEAIYCFPMIHDAQVTSFTVKIGNEVVKGKLEDSEIAYKIYEESMRKGDNSFLLETKTPDALQISLGNIKPMEKITVSITYIEDLMISNDNLRWLLPTTIAPRYTPDNISKNDVEDMVYGDEKYNLVLKIDIDNKNLVKKISSPSHGIQISENKENMIVEFAREFECLDRDFVLNIKFEEDRESLFLVGKHEDEYFGALKFIAQLNLQKSKQENKEYIFLLDISGSMEGEKLVQGKRALNIALRNLLEGDKFNIIAFNTYYQIFDGKSVNYSNENLLKSQQWIEDLQAYGGTEIYKPLEYVLKLPIETLDRVIFLFTDGQVNNELEIFHLAKEYSVRNSIYPFGIDTAINKYFIDGLATNGNGLPEYVYPGERIEDKVINQLARINQPFLSNVKIRNYFGEEIEVYPLIPNKLYSGEEYNFIFKGKSGDELNYAILEGKSNQGSFNTKINKIEYKRGDTLSIKWAKKYILYLESLFNKDNKRREKLLKEDIINASIHYGVLSTFTSLVAIYEVEDKKKGFMDTISIPLNFPKEWQMNDKHILYQASPTNYYQNSQIYESESESIIKAYNSNKSKVDIKELMLNIAAEQNADGSFRDNTIKTAYYTIAILLYKEENKPYKNQIKKAINYLLNNNDHELPVYLALKLAHEEDYKINNLNPIISFIEDTDVLGNFTYIYGIFNNDIEEFTSILFDESMDRKQLIEYLFKKI